MNFDYSYVYGGMPFNHGFFGVIGLLVIWELALKGWALWRAARNNQNGWFIALLLLNTAGILPLVYLFIIAPEDKKKKS